MDLLALYRWLYNWWIFTRLCL